MTEFEEYLIEPSISEVSRHKSLEKLRAPDKLLEYQSFKEKSQFFSQLFISDEEKLDQLLAAPTNHLIYRGVCEAKYMLYNSLQRTIIGKKIKKSYVDLWRTLINNAKEAQSGILVKYFNFVETKNLTDVAWLSYLQHHGCPTPLIDWTYSFEKALFFASNVSAHDDCLEKIENYVSIYAVHDWIADSLSLKSTLNELFSPIGSQSMLGEQALTKVDQIFVDEFGEQLASAAQDILQKRRRSRYFRERLQHIHDIDLLSTCALTFISDKDEFHELTLRVINSLNIVAQDGAFFFNPHPFAPLDWVFEKELVEPTSQEYNNCYCYNIHKALMPRIAEHLRSRDILKTTVFPDPYEICNKIAVGVLL